MSAFVYPAKHHNRRHGPRGYTEFQNFKPWLRDEFEFRCIYCLDRERWYPNGQEAFSVEHCLAQHLYPWLICDYDNLLYACLRCNSRKGAASVPDPTKVIFGQHLQVREDGYIEPLTDDGKRMVEILGLNRPARRVEFRSRMFAQVRLLQEKAATSPEAADLLRRWLGYPDDLPDLSGLKPPGGNSRPVGVTQSFHALREKRKLKDTY